MPGPPAPVRLRTALAALLLLLPVAGLGVDSCSGPVADPAALGPWEVARAELVLTDPTRDDRTLLVSIWYPVDRGQAVGPFTQYLLVLDGLPIATIVSDVARLTGPVSAQGPFPLVVFSHGNSGIRFQSYFLGEHLASHGMVVAAPDHAGNTALDLFAPGTPFEAKDRPLDISLVIDRMLEENGLPESRYFERIDAGRIGVAGHSFGGFTALAMAAGFEDLPADPRVRAIMPISPIATSLSTAELESIQIPLFILGGTSDITTPIDPQSVRGFGVPIVEPRYRVDVELAGHNSFTNVCQLVAPLFELPSSLFPPSLFAFLQNQVDEGCAPALIPLDEAHQITNRFATAFFRRHLCGDPRYEAYLTRGSIQRAALPVAFFAERDGP